MTQINKAKAYKGLKKFGGSFAQALGELLAVADLDNTAKIMICFPDVLKEHADLYQKWLDNQKSE